jgi:hypothetical protein
MLSRRSAVQNKSDPILTKLMQNIKIKPTMQILHLKYLLLHDTSCVYLFSLLAFEHFAELKTISYSARLAGAVEGVGASKRSLFLANGDHRSCALDGMCARVRASAKKVNFHEHGAHTHCEKIRIK